MHERLTEVLGLEVVGEVTRVGDAFFDVGLGRVALPDLTDARVEDLLGKLRQAFAGIQINDQRQLSDPGQVIRGLCEVWIPASERGTPYLLQLSTAGLFSLYERRFLLEKEQVGDLSGSFARGFCRIIAAGEAPLRLLSGFDELLRRYRELLEAAVQAAIRGTAHDPSAGVAELVPALRAAWRLIPWPLRQKLSPVSRLEQERIAPHDRVLLRTLLLAVDLLSGEVIYRYVHLYNPLEEYEQVLGWMTEIHRAMLVTYAPPRFATAVARAGSVDAFRVHYPGFLAQVGPPLPDAADA